MRFLRLLVFVVLAPLFALAQGQTIFGKVVRSDTKSVIQGANVFFSNSSYATATQFDGSFILKNVKPGQYLLTIAHLGYADYTETILVSDKQVEVRVEMAPKPIMLHEVNITTKADWKRNYEMFKKQFIGTDENAKDCEVVNPDVLQFNYFNTQKRLEAYADNFLVVDNRALGYRVKFLVRDFKFDAIEGLIQYSGQKLFEELPGSESEKKKWRYNRDMAYYGSAMHFFRAVGADRLEEEGFEMHRYTRYMNTQRPSEAAIMRAYDYYRAKGPADSVRKYVDLENTDRYSHEVFYHEPLFLSEVLSRTDKPGIFAFSFLDCMAIQYNRKRDDTHYRDIYLPLNVPNYETSILSFMTREQAAKHTLFFDMNGIVVGNNPLMEGTWSKARLSQLLPVDYQPTPQDMPAAFFTKK